MGQYMRSYFTLLKGKILYDTNESAYMKGLEEFTEISEIKPLLFKTMKLSISDAFSEVVRFVNKIFIKT